MTCVAPMVHYREKPKTQQPPQSSRCQKGDKKQVTYWKFTNIRHHRIPLVRWLSQSNRMPRNFMLQTNVVIFTHIISGLPAATLVRPLHHSATGFLLLNDRRKLKGHRVSVPSMARSCEVSWSRRTCSEAEMTEKGGTHAHTNSMILNFPPPPTLKKAIRL
jgi:hypothetical protein